MDQQDKAPSTTVDRATYGKAYQEGYDLTKRFLLSKGVPARSVEEAAQAAWVRGWERRDGLRNPDRIGPWVNSIALNLFRNQLRKDKRHDELGETRTADPTESTTSSIDVSRGLSACRPADRKLLVQSYVHGYTGAELAQKWSCKPVALRVRLMRARRRLARQLTSPQGANASPHPQVA